MRGFTTEALVLLSNASEFEEYSSMYKYNYQVAVRNLIIYLRSVGIEPACLITDRLACSTDMQHPKWLATGASEDLFFMRNYCGVPDYPVVELSPEDVETLRTKFPIERGLTPKARFSVVEKRVRWAERTLIQRFSLVAVFGNEFSVRTKPGDGRAILRVDKRFCPELTLSAEPVSMNNFMQVPFANQSILDWGRYING